jgi:glycosyltransferase involved in cell wall biosynthesis
LYPEVAEELGVLRKDGFPSRLLRWFSTWSLQRHHRVIAVGRCMANRLAARGINRERITVIPNWAVGMKAQGFAKRLSSAEPFTVLYSGNFGLAHPFESIIAAVRQLETEKSPIRFVFAGHGPRLTAVKEQLQNCRNVEFRDSVPLADLPASLAAADAHIACMSDALLGLVVPSKVYGGLGVGRPCLFLGPAESETALLITESKRGVVLPPISSGSALATTLRRWADRDEEFLALQRNCEAIAAEKVVAPTALFAQHLH